MPDHVVRIAVVGVSGVGKTSLIEDFISKFPKALHLSASSILKKHNAKLIDPNELNEERAERNQQIICTELRGISSNFGSVVVLFDAHTVLESKSQTIPTPIQPFEAFEPRYFIVIERPPSAILKFREADIHRRRPMGSVDRIDSVQKMSTDRALFFARQLEAIPHVLQSPGVEEFRSLVASLE